MNSATFDITPSINDGIGYFEKKQEKFTISDYANALYPITSRAYQGRCAYKNRGGQTGWASGPLTAARVHEHFSGYTGCGVGFITPGESTTRLALFDLDSHKGETSFADMTELANRLCTRLEVIGLHPVTFRSSGGSGVHIWMLWDTPQDAHSVRHALEGVLTAEGLRDGAGSGVAGGEVEIFPKQDEVLLERCGNMVVLPLWSKSELLIDEFGFGLGLEPVGREALIGMTWPMSDPVPHVVNTTVERVQGEYAAPDSLDKIERALVAIPNDTGGGTNGATDYDEWLRLGFATHEASAGSEEGFNLFNDWTNQNPGNAGRRKARQLWDQSKRDGVTRGTLYATASKFNPDWDAPTPDGFDDVSEGNIGTPNHVEQLPAFRRDKKGEILATKNNVMMALLRPDICGFNLGYDKFQAEVMVIEDGAEGWRSLKDTDYTKICLRLESGGVQNINKELIRDAIAHVSELNAFDSAQRWLNSLHWDGISRIERSLSVYFGAADTPYTRAVGLYLWTGLAGRTTEPGVKCDMVPVAVGEQGMRKSSAVAAIVPDAAFYIAIDLGGKDDELARLMRGKMVVELDELKGLGTRDSEHIKSLISRRFEEWIPKYREMNTRYFRRSFFFGTSNKDDFLADETGNRRWLPFRCGMCDPDAIARDRDQLWAEAREQFNTHGVLHRDAELLAKAEHESFVESDEWDTAVRHWLHAPDFLTGKKPYTRGFLTSRDVLKEAFQIGDAQQTRQHMLRMKKVLIRLGYTYENKRTEQGRQRGFVHPSLFQ